MTISAYPLQWPEGWKRTQGAYRLDARMAEINAAWQAAQEAAR